jgi:hypothetical protein
LHRHPRTNAPSEPRFRVRLDISLSLWIQVSVQLHEMHFRQFLSSPIGTQALDRRCRLLFLSPPDHSRPPRRRAQSACSRPEDLSPRAFRLARDRRRNCPPPSSSRDLPSGTLSLESAVPARCPPFRSGTRPGESARRLCGWSGGRRKQRRGSHRQRMRPRIRDWGRGGGGSGKRSKDREMGIRPSTRSGGSVATLEVTRTIGGETKRKGTPGEQ